MHQRMLVTLNMPSDATSDDVRHEVFERLVSDASFIGQEGGRFGAAVSDWFVIGGRWSGYLTNATDERNRFEEYGHTDDAQVLTSELYNAHLLPFLGLSEHQSEGFEYCDLDWDAVSPAMIDSKWLVVIDYHC